MFVYTADTPYIQQLTISEAYRSFLRRSCAACFRTRASYFHEKRELSRTGMQSLKAAQGAAFPAIFFHPMTRRWLNRSDEPVR